MSDKQVRAQYTREFKQEPAATHASVPGQGRAGHGVVAIARPTTHCGPLQWFACEVTPAPGNTLHGARAKDCQRRRFIVA